MNNENYIKDFKKANTELMLYMLSKDGGLAPVITVLVKNKEEQINVAVFPVPSEFLEDDDSKDKLAKQIPSLFAHLVKTGQEPICFSWSSEAWLRKAPEGLKKVPKNWKDLPKIECLISTYESKDESLMEIHEMVREGKMANENGELIDAISLKPYPFGDENVKKTEGRFGNLFEEYYKMKQDGEL